MNSKTFENELNAIYCETNKRVVALVNQAQADEGLYWNIDKPLSFADSPNWNYRADAFAELTGWIYDRVRGMSVGKDKKSMTKKIRMALG